MDVVAQLTAATGVLALLGVTLWWLRRRGIATILPAKRSTGRRLECLERLPLSPQHTLHLVRLGSKVILISSSPSGCAMMDYVSSAELESRL